MIIKSKTDKSRVGKLLRFVEKHNLVIRLSTVITDNSEVVEARILDYHFNNGEQVSAIGDNEDDALDSLARRLKEFVYISTRKEIEVKL